VPALSQGKRGMKPEHLSSLWIEYLLEHLGEFQAELKDYSSIKWADPPKP
jgi:hypothetical protein